MDNDGSTYYVISSQCGYSLHLQQDTCLNSASELLLAGFDVLGLIEVFFWLAAPKPHRPLAFGTREDSAPLLLPTAVPDG